MRIDSGDLLYLSKKVREILDAVGNTDYRNTEIMVSGDLNESIIKGLLENKAPIDSFAVGTELSTSRDSSVINCVYKLVAIRVQEKDKSDLSSENIKLHSGIIASDIDRMVIIYKAKKSLSKHTLPGPKQIHRIMDNKGILVEDIISLADESMEEGSLPLLEKIIENGSIVKSLPQLSVIQKYYKRQIQMMPFLIKKDQEQRFPVSYSQKLVRLAKKLGIVD
ncbi:hypothetical protein [Candidatus Nitrosocosmicus franklandus]|uniref:nicotinate phosphoribosyltransferase n=1 Tax=Candidatus Nitrosocosmicus franklandianus TaxID=1798806 RepID=A0A484IAK4_9ARCH